MNTMKSVFSKIAEDKTELAKHEVQLGLIDDFKKLSDKALSSGTNAGGNINDWLNKLPKLIEALKSSQKDQKAVIDLGEKIKKQAKDLGLDLPANIQKEIKGSEQWFDEIATIIKKAQGFKL